MLRAIRTGLRVTLIGNAVYRVGLRRNGEQWDIGIVPGRIERTRRNIKFRLAGDAVVVDVVEARRVNFPRRGQGEPRLVMMIDSVIASRFGGR